MKPIAIFYHGLLFHGEPPEFRPAAFEIMRDHMILLHNTGLLFQAREVNVCLNGGDETFLVSQLIVPGKARIALHGLQCHNECRTILEIEKWLPTHPDWYVLYFHCKGATHKDHDPMRTVWRDCMTRACVSNWRQCVRDLDAGFEAVGCHWMVPPATPPGQHIFAGSFWWANSNFLATLPSIMQRDRIKVSGLDSIESRYEAEVWIGNGPRLPKVKDYHGPDWNPSKIATCNQFAYAPHS